MGCQPTIEKDHAKAGTLRNGGAKIGPVVHLLCIKKIGSFQPQHFGRRGRNGGFRTIFDADGKSRRVAGVTCYRPEDPGLGILMTEKPVPPAELAEDGCAPQLGTRTMGE